MAADWDDMRVALAVARAGTLAGAARALRVDHSTVFRRLRAFERGLGVKLFSRQGGVHAPTAAGEDLIAVAQRIEEEVLGLDRRVTGRDIRLAGAIRATAPDTLALRFLAPRLARFRQAYPGIAVELVIDNQFLNLSKREADVAIRPTRRPPENLIGRKVAGVAFALYGGRGARAPGRKGRAPAEWPWLALDDSLAHLASMRWLAANAPDVRIGLRANSYLMLAAAAAAGLGVAHLPCFVGDTEPGLRRIGPVEPEMASELWLLTHADLRAAARVRAFTDFMAETIRADRDLLEGRRPRA